MIKNPFFAWCSLILFMFFAHYSIDRFLFLKTAVHTSGTVVGLSSQNGRCGYRRSRYDCTRYDASVDFIGQNKKKYSLLASAGSRRGHNVPVEEATKKINDSVPVVYDPENPFKSFVDEFWDIWSTPVVLFFLMLVFFTMSISELKRRDEIGW